MNVLQKRSMGAALLCMTVLFSLPLYAEESAETSEVTILAGAETVRADEGAEEECEECGKTQSENADEVLSETEWLETEWAVAEENGETERDENDSMTADAWFEYLGEKVIPAAVLAVSSVLSVYITVSPALYHVKKRSDAFGKAAVEVRSVAKEAEEQRRQMTRTERALASATEEMKRELSAYGKELRAVREMLKIGFANQEELVSKGVAETIFAMDGSIDSKDGEDESETSET